MLLLLFFTVGLYSSCLNPPQKKAPIVHSSDKNPNYVKPDTRPADNINNHNKPVNNTKPSTVTKPDYKPVIQNLPENTKKDPPKTNSNTNTSGYYKIAIILPFQVPYIDSTGLASPQVSDNSNMALEFYEGIKSALENLQLKGLSCKVSVYDSGESEDRVRQILADSTLKNTDVIFGPSKNGQNKIIAEFAKQNKIYHLSPFTPANNISSNNPYYWAANPSIETHLAAMYKYVAKTYANRRIITICDNKPNEINLANTLSNIANLANREQTGYVPVQQITYTGQSITEIEAKLSPSEQNVIIIPSFKEIFATTIVQKLRSLSNKYKITLFGMPNWKTFENVDIEYLAALNFHYTSPFWVDEYASTQQSMRQDFYRKYNYKPSDYAMEGYDLMQFVGDLLLKNGNNLSVATKSSESKQTYTSFDFKAASANMYSGALFATDYFENKYLNIIRLRSDYSFEKMND